MGEAMTTQLIVRLVLFALPLGLDTFALSTVLGVTPLPMRSRVRLALTFAAAEGLMPAVGLLLGLPLGNALGAWSGYLAGVMICGVGVWMWWKDRRTDDKEDKDDAQDTEGEAALIARAATATGWGLVGLAVSVSLDELAVGFSFGVLRIPLVPALVLIALQALVVSVLGQWVGSRLGHQLGEQAERVAGPALCLLGLWFIAAQVFGIPL
jgi:manganese efflux pump family protein